MICPNYRTSMQTGLEQLGPGKAIIILYNKNGSCSVPEWLPFLLPCTRGYPREPARAGTKIGKGVLNSIPCCWCHVI